MMFWLILAAALSFITLASECCFDRKWLRAFISSALAFECAAFLCGGYLT